MHNKTGYYFGFINSEIFEFAVSILKLVRGNCNAVFTRSISVYLGALPRIDLAPQDGIEPPTF